MSEKSVITKFNQTGHCEVDVDEVVRQWGDEERWSISQWKDEYRLIKQSEEDPEACEIKVGISVKQAGEIIAKVGLRPIQSPLFASGKTWRKGEEIARVKK